jgi:hypothetical protein
MTPATERLKKMVDKLSEEDAGLLLTIARQLSKRHRLELDEDRRDLEDALRAEREAAASGEPPVPLAVVRRDLGL